MNSYYKGIIKNLIEEDVKYFKDFEGEKVVWMKLLKVS